MLLLALDTTAEFGSIALVSHAADGDTVIEEVVLHEPQGYSGVLFAEIAAILARQSVKLSDIDLFAGASGPGSFTGVRIGLAAIKGFGEVLGKPVVAVSNLRVLAEYGTGELRATVIDARRGEVFAALYNHSGEQVIAEQVIRFSKFLEILSDYEFEWICSDFDPFLPDITNSPSAAFPRIQAPRSIAATAAKIAQRCSPTNAAVVEANYVRRSDAEMLLKA